VPVDDSRHLCLRWLTSTILAACLAHIHTRMHTVKLYTRALYTLRVQQWSKATERVLTTWE
jgi:hypothetical protein